MDAENNSFIVFMSEKFSLLNYLYAKYLIMIIYSSVVEITVSHKG